MKIHYFILFLTTFFIKNSLSQDHTYHEYWSFTMQLSDYTKSPNSTIRSENKFRWFCRLFFFRVFDQR